MTEITLVVLLVALLSLASISFCAGRVFLFAYAATIGTISIFVAPVVVSVFGYPLSVGEILYAVLFLLTDLVAEHHGKKEARLVVWISLLVMATIGVVMQLVAIMIPHNFDAGMPHLLALMDVAPRIMAASTIMFIAEQHFDIWFYLKIRGVFGSKRLWLRNNLSTMTTQFLDVLIYYPIVFWGVYPSIGELMLAAFAFKATMAVVDTGFVYATAAWLGSRRAS